MKFRILLLEEIAESALALIKDAEDCEIVHSVAGYDPVTIDAIIARGKLKVTSELISKMPRLKAIARCGVGVDNVNVSFATDHNIQVLNTPGVNADTVAEHAIGMIIMLQRKLYQSVREVKNGNWQYRVQYDGDEIRGKTLGILGMGNIGAKVSRLAECFGMKIQYWNRKKKDVDYSMVTLDELLSTSDVISIHLPLSEETTSFVNKEKLKMMKKGVLLVNTARGPIVDEGALITALSKGEVGGYAADVPALLSQEKDYELLKFENVLITPHAASLTKRTFDEICELAVVNTMKCLRGEGVDNQYKVN